MLFILNTIAFKINKPSGNILKTILLCCVHTTKPRSPDTIHLQVASKLSTTKYSWCFSLPSAIICDAANTHRH
ncbi:unnamed protein product [Rhizophagus irregularis]|nr:unnamed protein product [Rhizophagus irregularis]